MKAQLKRLKVQTQHAAMLAPAAKASANMDRSTPDTTPHAAGVTPPISTGSAAPALQ